MRPLRFLLLLSLFVVLPIILTCVSLFSSRRSGPESFQPGYSTRAGRLRALFSFSTPSSLFPPSAIISLTDDNSTSFIARPAAFGPSLPSHGLSGQLWIGKGFGEDISFAKDELRSNGLELGCSDVPDWNIEIIRRPENGAFDGKFVGFTNEDLTSKGDTQSRSSPVKRDETPVNGVQGIDTEDDGTDDYLHHPLPDSNPASPEKPGEPASVHTQDKSRPPTHADIESLQESADIAGKIVMLSRGGCGFLEKVKWAQRRGGIALIVGDNTPGEALTIMYARSDTSNITIPAIFTSYYSAQLLSSLLPPEEKSGVGNDRHAHPNKDGKSGGSKAVPNAKQSSGGHEKEDHEKGWVKNVLSAVGLDDETDPQNKDSRRPPGSGNIDWVLLEDWDEDKAALLTTNTQFQKAATATGRATKSTSTISQATDNDDFIIGVQDWRDTELIAPKSTATQDSKKHKGKVELTASQTLSPTSSMYPVATSLTGGIITPGSGEYDHQKQEPSGRYKSAVKSTGHSASHDNGGAHLSFGEKLAAFFRLGSHKSLPSDHDSERGHRPSEDKPNHEPDHKPKKHHGLWVTLTPASQSTNPFFDTLLVLVVSPLVTLTFVYGLLLLRSRIRRRRWRAPKSIVERLPVRTYHTMSESSMTSSVLTSPQPSSNSSPTLGPTSHTRVRPRSQTTTGVFSSSSSAEKTSIRHSPKRKRYTGRQVECVVCLEEYVDGESKVMSLPCGHEFHVDCITPWLVTRRRTCPICKGDVVRSLARRNGDSSSMEDDLREEYEQTSDDVQERAVMTENVSESAAIPIPVAGDISTAGDIERGSDVETPLLGSTPRVPQGRWRGLLSGSLGRLSGDTVWRSSVNDRSR